MQMPNRRPPAAAAPASFGRTLGVIAVAFGIGVVGAYMLDLHGHTCDRCGHRWRHLGAFNLGDEDAHTCKHCGDTQWWKCGVPQALKNAHRALPAPRVGQIWYTGPELTLQEKLALAEGRG